MKRLIIGFGSPHKRTFKWSGIQNNFKECLFGGSEGGLPKEFLTLHIRLCLSESDKIAVTLI